MSHSKSAILKPFFYGAALAGLLAACAPTQDRRPATADQPEMQTQEARMGMRDTMMRMQQHCTVVRDSLDELIGLVREARESEDPVRMGQALDRLMQPLGDLRTRADRCAVLMDDQQANGMGNGGMNGDKNDDMSDEWDGGTDAPPPGPQGPPGPGAPPPTPGTPPPGMPPPGTPPGPAM